MVDEIIAKLDLNKPIKDYVEKYRDNIADMTKPMYWWDALKDKVYEDILSNNPTIDPKSREREEFRAT